MAQYSMPDLTDKVSKINYSLASTKFLGTTSSNRQGQFSGSKSSGSGSNDVSYNIPQYDNGDPFLNFRDYAGRMTDNYSSSNNISSVIGSQGLPFNNTESRQNMINNGIGFVNSANKQLAFATGTMGKSNFSTKQCTQDEDCAQFTDGNYTCNPNYQGWEDAKGNQPGSVCVLTVYPELNWSNKEGTRADTYMRKLGDEGGIGTQCTSDNDCGTGYKCNNSYDFVGSSNQQAGYCAQPYKCPGDSTIRYLGTPNNSSIPIVPDRDQNNNGKGYKTQVECLANMSGAQKCVSQNGAWFAVYPGYCPVNLDNRVGGSKQGALTSTSNTSGGFILQSMFGSSQKSSLGGQRALNELQTANSTTTPLEMLAQWNGATEKQSERLGAFFNGGN